MKKKIKKTIIWSAALCLALTLGNCSTDENSRNQVTSTQQEINTTSISKSWILTHFTFTATCNPIHKVNYQVSSILLDLNQSNYTAIDAYSLIEKQGMWKLEGDILTLYSDKGQDELKMRILNLSANEMKAVVLDHPDVVGVEFIQKR